MVETMYWMELALFSERLDDMYLNAVVTVGKVFHGLELFVDDTDAGFVCSVDDALDVLCALAHLLQFDVQALGSFDGGLGVKFG
jgi:hypothetical protein